MHTFHILWQILMKLCVKDSHLMLLRSAAICENQRSDSHTKRNFVLLSTLFCTVLYKIRHTIWPQFIEWLWVLWKLAQWKRYFPERTWLNFCHSLPYLLSYVGDIWYKRCLANAVENLCVLFLLAQRAMLFLWV